MDTDIYVQVLQKYRIYTGNTVIEINSPHVDMRYENKISHDYPSKSSNSLVASEKAKEKSLLTTCRLHKKKHKI